MSVKDVARQSSVVFETRHTAWLTQFLGLMFSQVLQRH